MEPKKRGRPRKEKAPSSDMPKPRGRPKQADSLENETTKIQIYPPQWLLDAFDQLKEEGLLAKNLSRSEGIQYAMAELIRQLTGVSPGEIKRRWGGRRSGERWLTPPDYIPPSMVYKGIEELAEEKNIDPLDLYPDVAETNAWAYQWQLPNGKWERSTSTKRKAFALEGAMYSVSIGHKARIIYNGKVLKVLKPDTN